MMLKNDCFMTLCYKPDTHKKTHKTYQIVMQSETALNSALCIENKDCVSATYNILRYAFKKKNRV